MSTPLLNPVINNTESRKKCFMISTLIILTHGLFIYAQGFGKLARGTMKFHIDYKAKGALEELLKFIGINFCSEYTPECSTQDYNLTSTMGTICHIIECKNLILKKTIIEMSYIESIKELWNQDYPPGNFAGRPAAISLIIFSLIWPHIKLFLMHIYFYKSTNRQKVNYWLTFFGKWSLIDVLVMCLIIAIFNINIELSILQLWNGLSSKFIELCEGICTTIAEPTFDCNSTCEYIDMLLNATVIPSNIPNSNIKIILQMDTLLGIYSFCVAVIFSLFTGIFIENIDKSPRDLVIRRPVTRDSIYRDNLLERCDTRRVLQIFIVSVQFLLTLFAIKLYLLERHVIGSLPNALKIFGTSLDKSYNLLDIATIIGNDENSNYGNKFIEVVFLFFIVIVPLLQPILLFTKLRHLAMIFFSLELLVLVIPILDMTFGPMSALLLNSKTFPLCTIFNKLFPSKPSDHETCMMINVDVGSTYYFIIVISILYFISYSFTKYI